jgi:hypothetical protein
LRRYAHTSLTLPSYCGVHTVFLFCVVGRVSRLGRATHEGNTAWTPQYEGSVSEVWAYILKQRRRAVVAYNILTYELIECGGFNRLTVASGWPCMAETCRNSKIKCDYNDVLGNLNVIVMTF